MFGSASVKAKDHWVNPVANESIRKLKSQKFSVSLTDYIWFSVAIMGLMIVIYLGCLFIIWKIWAGNDDASEHSADRSNISMYAFDLGSTCPGKYVAVKANLECRISMPSIH
jgi:hypothetical protein